MRLRNTTSIMRARRSRRGFTLMEMLIVVAIIAVLVAIAIPIFTAQLAKARKAADDANCRAAKALASVECMSEYDGKFSAKTPDEWVTYVTSEAGTIPLTGQLDGSTLTCSYNDSSITFVYGGSGSGTSGGSVVLTDSSGKKHTFTGKDWDTLKAGHTNGMNVAQGTVLTDGTGTYVVSWNDWIAGDLTNMTLAQAVSNGANLIRITNDTKILTSADTVTKYGNQVWPSEVAAGTICYMNGSYYLAPGTINVNTFPPGGWVAITM